MYFDCSIYFIKITQNIFHSYVFYRLLLKGALPLTEDHFVIGNTQANLRLGLNIGGTDINAWRNPNVELTSTEILADTTNTPSSFICDYVEVDPLN